MLKLFLPLPNETNWMTHDFSKQETLDYLNKLHVSRPVIAISFSAAHR